MSKLNYYLEEIKKNKSDDLSIDKLISMFKKINKDAKENNESVVELNDIEYYTNQIMNIYNLSKKQSKTLAKQIAEKYNNEGKKDE